VYRVDSASSVTKLLFSTVAVDLAKLESGEAVPNNHVLIGEHVALYPACVYEYEQRDSGDPNNNTKVTHLFYPIISKSHPAMSESSDGVESFAVMVKTEQFPTIGSIPDVPAPVGSIQGLIINDIDGLDSEEKDLVRSSFPNVNFDKLLVLEVGRQPASLFKSLGMSFGGAVIVLLGIGWFFVGRRSEA
jgi:hypothetical protein